MRTRTRRDYNIWNRIGHNSLVHTHDTPNSTLLKKVGQLTLIS